MFANKYKINVNTILSGATATTINIPLNMEYQLVDQAELVQNVFVQTEVQNSINPILDYEKIRYKPLDPNGNVLNTISYSLIFTAGTTFASVGFTNYDITYQTNAFLNTFLRLDFYDSDNPLTQNLIFYVVLYPTITTNNLVPSNSSIGIVGQPLPADQLQLVFQVSNPILFPRNSSEGYYLYGYKDTLSIGQSTYLYMRATFNNAKTGQSTNMMVMPNPDYIDNLVHKLFTRYVLSRATNGYFYQLDQTYNGNGLITTTNISFPTNSANINLYQILSL